jgi:uncharacterized membrane protein
MTEADWLKILRIIHIAGFSILIGGETFSYFFVRPTLRRIPPPQAAVVEQRLGNLSVYIFGAALVLLFLSGLLRIYLMYDGLGVLGDIDFYKARYGRAITIMYSFWFLAMVSYVVLALYLRPKVLHRLRPEGNPGARELGRLRAQRDTAALWIYRVRLIILTFAILAAVGGAVASLGGLF